MSDASLSEKVAEEIRAMLARKRVSASELARRLDVSHTWVTNRLAGHREIGLSDLERIAAALEVEITDLLPASATRESGSTQIKGSWSRPADRPSAGLARLLPDCDHHGRTPKTDSHPTPAHPGNVRPGARRPAIQPWTDAGVTA